MGSLARRGHTTSKPCVLAGIDVCGAGWIVVLAQRPHPLRLTDATVATTFADAMAFASAAAAVAVDIPIGLADQKFRECDLVAREMMERRFKCRVFKTSPRRAIMAKTVPDRHRLHRELTGEGLPPPAAAFAGKVAEVDAWMLTSGKPQDRVFEVHPELCFMALNGGKPVVESKHGAASLRIRYGLLRPFFRGLDVAAWARHFLASRPRSAVKEDDVVDAVVACVTAAMWAPEATIPRAEAPRDSHGLYMRMVCLRREGPQANCCAS